jgi:hypothetical protein
MWRGWTSAAAADDYERFLLDELFPSMRSIPGFLGADVLRRPDGDEVAFVTLTRFRSLDDIRASRANRSTCPSSSRAPRSCSRASSGMRCTSTRRRSASEGGYAERLSTTATLSTRRALSAAAGHTGRRRLQRRLRRSSVLA